MRTLRERIVAFALHVARWLAYLSVSAYYGTVCRIRGWGSLPRERPASLVVANHQHEMESPVIVAALAMSARMWRRPMYTISSRRMWEPGFFAERIPWLQPVMRTVNLGWLFAGIGMQPIENELHSRPFVSIADALYHAHGDLPAATVFRERALKRIPGIVTLADLLAPRHFTAARSVVSLSELHEPYRAEMLLNTRAQLDADIAHFEDLVRSGATIFLTPEGFYSGDGKMQRLRGILAKLAPLARIYIAGISYDPFVGRRLSLMYRIREADPGLPLEADIKRTRPVTTSALIATWLHGRTAPFGESAAIEAVSSQLRELPSTLFVDPELRQDPTRMTRAALTGMTRLSIVRHYVEAYALTQTRRHPQFPRTSDMIAYQANFHAETLEGARIAQGSSA
jgi:hypothetical protein